MIVVVGDQLVDVAIAFPSFPLQAGQMQRAVSFQIGPGGAGNVAIAAARMGHAVACLAEVGDDEMGSIVRRGLEAEGVDTGSMLVTPGAATPVAGVLVDDKGEPAYLGFPGSLRGTGFPAEWIPRCEQAEAVYADGWSESEAAASFVLVALARAQQAGVLTFFDPGPGNPALDNAWHHTAVRSSHVVVLNQAELNGLSGRSDPLDGARLLLAEGPETVIVKRGANGILAVRRDEHAESPGFRVPVVDTTGAGDSVGAAVMNAVLRGLPLGDLAILADATGAAKVQKRGTGRNMPTRAEVRAVLQESGRDADKFMPPSRPAPGTGGGKGRGKGG